LTFYLCSLTLSNLILISERVLVLSPGLPPGLFFSQPSFRFFVFSPLNSFGFCPPPSFDLPFTDDMEVFSPLFSVSPLGWRFFSTDVIFKTFPPCPEVVQSFLCLSCSFVSTHLLFSPSYWSSGFFLHPWWPVTLSLPPPTHRVVSRMLLLPSDGFYFEVR